MADVVPARNSNNNNNNNNILVLLVVNTAEKTNAYGMRVGKPYSNRPLGRPKFAGKDNINMDLKNGA
jgi:hypothetical protein